MFILKHIYLTPRSIFLKAIFNYYLKEAVANKDIDYHCHFSQEFEINPKLRGETWNSEKIAASDKVIDNGDHKYIFPYDCHFAERALTFTIF